MKPFAERVIQWGTYILVFLTPIIYFGASRYIPYTTSKTFFFYGGVEILLALWLYQAFTDRSYRFSKKDLLFFCPLFVYIGWLTLAGILGVDPGMSFWSSLGRGTGLLSMYHVIALTFIIASLIKKYGLQNYGYRLLAWFVGGASILAVSVWLGNEGFNLPFQFLLKSKGGGLVGNSSLTGTTFVFAIFLEVFLLSAKSIKQKYKIFLSLALALILFSPLFLSIQGLLSSVRHVFVTSISARGAALGIVLGALSFVPFYWMLSQNKRKKLIGTVLITVGVISFCFAWYSVMTPGTKLHQTFAQSAGESRFIFWNIAKSAMNENPLLGYGPENYHVAYQKYFDPRIFTLSNSVEVWNDRAHNIFFDIGVSGGWPALILYGAFLGSLFYGLHKAFLKGKISRVQTGILGSLLIAYFFQHLFVFDSLLSLMDLGIVSGIIFGLNAGNEVIKEKSLLSKNTKNVSAVLLVAAFIPAWIFFVWLPSRKAVAFSDVLSLPLNSRADHYQDLLKGSPIGNDFEVGAIAEDSFMLYSKNQKDIPADPKLLEYSLKDLKKFTDYLEEVAKKEPQEYRLRLNLARLYNISINLSDDNDEVLTEKALRVETEAMKLSSTDPQIYWAQGITKFRAGDVEEAKDIVRKAIEIAPYVDFSTKLLNQFSSENTSK